MYLLLGELSIITKNGLLVFTHSFAGSILTSVDVDMQAGLLTAVLNALRETQGETIQAIKQGEITLLLYEGILTFGILSTSEDDPKLRAFLRDIVLKFELAYTRELHTESILSRVNFESFKDIIRHEYSNMHKIDVDGLEKILALMRNSIISNYAIYELQYFNPVFTSILDPTINAHTNLISQIFRGIFNLAGNLNQNHQKSELIFNEIHLIALGIATHCLVLFIHHNRRDKIPIKKELDRITNKLAEV